METKWEEKKKILTEELEKTEKLLASVYDRLAQLGIKAAGLFFRPIERLLRPNKFYLCNNAE